MRQQRQPRAAQRRTRGFGLKATVLIGLVFVGILSLLGATRPDNAKANVIGDALGTVGDLAKGGLDIVTDPTGALTGAMKAALQGVLPTILNQLFSGLQAKFTMSVLDGLVELNNPAKNSNVGQLGETVQALSFGLLAAVLTITFLRYYFQGLGSGFNGFEPAQAFMRVIGACAAVIVWPWAFSWAIDVQNAFVDAFWNSPSLHDDLKHLFEALNFTFVAGAGFMWFIGILLAMAAAVLLIGLVCLKIILSASLVLLFVAMPLCLIVWPIPEMSWLAGAAMRLMVTLLLIPIVWGLIFAAAAAVGMDALAFKGSGTFVDALTKPLVALSLMWLAFIVPKHLTRMAMMGLPMVGGSGRGGGFISGMGRYMAARRLDAAIAPHLPAWAGGQTPRGQNPGTPKPQPSGSNPAGGPMPRAEDFGYKLSVDKPIPDAEVVNDQGSQAGKAAQAGKAGTAASAAKGAAGAAAAATGAGAVAGAAAAAQGGATGAGAGAAKRTGTAATGTGASGASSLPSPRVHQLDRPDKEGLPEKPSQGRYGDQAKAVMEDINAKPQPALTAREALGAMTPTMRNQIGDQAAKRAASGHPQSFAADMARFSVAPSMTASESTALQSLARTPPSEVAAMAETLRSERAPVTHLSRDSVAGGAGVASARTDVPMGAPQSATSGASGTGHSASNGTNGGAGARPNLNGAGTGGVGGDLPPTPTMRPQSPSSNEVAKPSAIPPTPQRPPTDLN